MKEDENRRRVEEGLTTGLTKEVSLFICLFGGVKGERCEGAALSGEEAEKPLPC